MFSTLKSRVNIKSTVAKYNNEIVVILIYSLYLLIVPQVLKFSIPCLGAKGEMAYTFQECNIHLVLDKLVVVILIGYVVTTLTYYLYKGRGKLKQTIAVSVVLLVLSIAAYYIYLIPVTSKAYNNPVILTPTKNFEDVNLNIQ